MAFYIVNRGLWRATSRRRNIVLIRKYRSLMDSQGLWRATTRKSNTAHQNPRGHPENPKLENPKSRKPENPKTRNPEIPTTRKPERLKT